MSLTTIIMAAGATIGFATLFGVPIKYFPYCGFIGSVSWFLYEFICTISSETVASFVATFVVMLLTRWFAVKKRCPATIFLLSGIIPLVPGAGIYWAAYYIVTEELNLALQAGFQALQIVVAIVLGIVIVFEIPHQVFQLGQKRGKK